MHPQTPGWMCQLRLFRDFLWLRETSLDAKDWLTGLCLPLASPKLISVAEFAQLLWRLLRRFV